MVDATGEAAVGFERQESHPGKVPLDSRQRRVGTVVVDDHRLKVAEFLVLQCRQALKNDVAAVVVDDDDGNPVGICGYGINKRHGV